jgi:pescadillo protein
MPKERKKGQAGSAALYLTRNDALRKLQLTLPEFRKICILKGIYPREPKKKFKGKDKTYYYKKDIVHLIHDPLIQKFRERRVWKKKLKKAKAKKEKDKIERLHQNKPRYTLHHLVKERYPSFIDAVRDMDDALSMISLFANFASDRKIHKKRIDKCRRFILEFEYYVIKTNALRKVFLSIKGVYYQAEIFGETVTWLSPYQFAIPRSNNVDYRVMLTFLEFYEVLMGFINFKLFNSMNMKYPPSVDQIKSSHGEYLNALTSESVKVDSAPENESDPKSKPKADKEIQKRIATLSSTISQIQEESDESDSDSSSGNESYDQGAQMDEDAIDDFGDEETKNLRREQNVYGDLLKGCVFWLNREVPKYSLEFVIKSFGGKVAWDGDCSPIESEKDDAITHHIIDRPKVTNPSLGVDYVQPQYVYDCINARVLLDASRYAPGVELPPHLSPFVNDDEEGYKPEYKFEMEMQYNKANGIEEEDDEPSELITENQDSDEDPEEVYERELKQEKEGDNYTNVKRKYDNQKSVSLLEELEQSETATALLSKKRRRLLQRIEYGKRKRQGDLDKRFDKKRKLESGTAIIKDNKVVYVQEDEE